jgi:hypothetical protein
MTEATEPTETVATQPTPAKEWSKERAAKPIEVPSGNIAMVRRRSLTVWWKTGKIPNLLLPLVRESIATGKPVLQEKTAWTEEELKEMVLMMDTAVIECVDAPRVYPEPVCKECKREERDAIHNEHDYIGEERDPDRLYVDDVDFDDKAFIYQYVIGAVDDVASFRKLQADDVDAVPDGSDVGNEAISVGGDTG